MDGFDSGVPHGQARVGVSFPGWVTGERIRLDVWGYVASLETETDFNGNDSFTPWTVGASWHVPLIDTLALRGEIWYGQALSDIRGTIGQNVNVFTGDEIEGWGGWIEMTWQLTPELQLVLGGSVDNPQGDDLPAGGRDLNWVLYTGAVYNFGGGLKSGLDLMYWEHQVRGRLAGQPRPHQLLHDAELLTEGLSQSRAPGAPGPGPRRQIAPDLQVQVTIAGDLSRESACRIVDGPGTLWAGARWLSSSSPWASAWAARACPRRSRGSGRLRPGTPIARAARSRRGIGRLAARYRPLGPAPGWRGAP